MSLPRPVLPGVTYLLTRRCIQRQFLLRPSAIVNQIFAYCLAVAVERYNMLLHAVCVISNHYHIVVTDLLGNRPEFERYLNEFTAKCINALLGREDVVWSPGRNNATILVDPEDVLSRMVYTAVNPVKAGLVRQGHQWPGLLSRPCDVGKEIKVARPDVFFRKDGTMPEVAVLKTVRPPAFNQISDQEFSDLFDQAVTRREEEIRAEFDLEGRRFLGRRAVLKASPFSIPSSQEEKKRKKSPVACRNKPRRNRALQWLQNFVRDYRRAWERLKSGCRDVVFPAGTYWLRVNTVVQCVECTDWELMFSDLLMDAQFG